MNSLRSPKYKVAAAVPGMDGFLKAVPEGGGGTMVDSLLGLGSTSTTEGEAQDLVGLASLAGSFQSLGLSLDDL